MAELEPLFGGPILELVQGIMERVRSGETRTDQFYRECGMCLNSGMAFTSRTIDGQQVRGVMDCRSCDKGIHRKRDLTTP
jgi:hypothetical protein